METTPKTINKVAAALNISADTYINLNYNAGFEYIEKQHRGMLQNLGNTSAKNRRRLNILINVFKTSPVFWFWWRGETETADRAFLRTGSASLKLYTQMLNTRLLVPPDEVINEIFTTTKQTQPA